MHCETQVKQNGFDFLKYLAISLGSSHLWPRNKNSLNFPKWKTFRVKLKKKKKQLSFSASKSYSGF